MNIVLTNIKARVGASAYVHIGSRIRFNLARLLAHAGLGLQLALGTAGIRADFNSYAGSKSDYLENKLLDGVLGGTNFSQPATVYFALFTVAPSDSGGGTEVTGGSYARVAVTNNSTNFPAASGGSKANGTTITWTTASASWGTVLAVGVFDASTGGNLLYWTTITSKTVDSGDTVSIAASGFTITED